MNNENSVIEILKMLEEFDSLISKKRLLKNSIKDTDERIVDLVSKGYELIGHDLEKFVTLYYRAIKAFDYELRKLMSDEEYNELIELMLPKDSKSSKIQTQDKVYDEEYKKSANLAWILADYLIENPQNYLEPPWTLIPVPVRETIEYIVNCKKIVTFNLSRQSIQPKSLDMDALRAEAEEIMVTGGTLSTSVSAKEMVTELVDNGLSIELERAIIKEPAHERLMEERTAYYKSVREEIQKRETKPESND